MFIDPDMQDQGLGTIVWTYIELKYPKTKKWLTEPLVFQKEIIISMSINVDFI